MNLSKHHHSNRNDHRHHHNSDNNDSSTASNPETPATDTTTTETQSATPETLPTDQTAVAAEQPAVVTEDTTASEETNTAAVKIKTNNLAMVKVNIKDKKSYCSEDCVSTCKASGFVAFSSEFLECSKLRCLCSNNSQVFRVLNSINSKSFGNLSTYLGMFALLLIFVSFFIIIYYGKKKETEIKSNRKNYALLETEALDNNDNFEINEI